MKSPCRSRITRRAQRFIEPLEQRQLLSVTAPVRTPTVAPARTATTVATSTSAAAVSVSGIGVHAELGQAFTAVIGTLKGILKLPSGYSLRGEINWGDGTPPSAAQFVRQADGSIAVAGSHTYDVLGSQLITATIMQVPPPGSEAPIILLGTIHSKADVFASKGGVTVEATANTPFTAAVGFFSSKLPLDGMVAVINWGDGAFTIGKILALPTADPVGGRFEVVGNHSYDQIGSYRVQVWVLTSAPPVASSAASSLIATIGSVVDVLPISPIAST